MMDLKLYGTGTSGSQFVKSTLQEFLNKAEIPFHMDEITDVNIFLSKKIESVPAIEIENKVLTLKSNGSFNQSLRDAVKYILQKENFGKIPQFVIPIDYSDVSMNAFFYGQRLASHFGAIVNLINVFTPINTDISGHVFYENEHIDLIDKQLQEFVEKYDTDWGTEVLKNAFLTGSTQVGFPADKIASFAEESKSKMIIMGTTGNNLTTKILGSVTKAVIDKANVPVLVVPKSAGFKQIKNVIIAADTQEDVEPMMDSLKDIIKVFNPKISLVHHGKEDFHIMGITNVEKHTVKGSDPIASVNNFVTENNADLVVVLKKHHSFWDNLIYRSFSKDLALLSDVPVLVVK